VSSLDEIVLRGKTIPEITASGIVFLRAVSSGSGIVLVGAAETLNPTKIGSRETWKPVRKRIDAEAFESVVRRDGFTLRHGVSTILSLTRLAPSLLSGVPL
jgi:hypothetical protein